MQGSQGGTTTVCAGPRGGGSQEVVTKGAWGVSGHKMEAREQDVADVTWGSQGKSFHNNRPSDPASGILLFLENY